MNEHQTPLDFADKVLDAWGDYFISSGEYRKLGLSYVEAIEHVYKLQNDPKERASTIRQFRFLFEQAEKLLRGRGQQ